MPKTTGFGDPKARASAPAVKDIDDFIAGAEEAKKSRLLVYLPKDLNLWVRLESTRRGISNSKFVEDLVWAARAESEGKHKL